MVRARKSYGIEMACVCHGVYLWHTIVQKRYFYGCPFIVTRTERYNHK